MGGTCDRIAVDAEGRGVVQEQEGGAWTTSFAFSDEEWERMELRGDDCAGAANPHDGFRSITAIDDVVLVPMGSQGLLRREGAGDWERIAVGGAEPLRIDGPIWIADLVMLPGLLLIAALGLPVLALVLGRGWPRALVAGGLVVAGAAALGGLAAVLDFNAADYTTVGRAMVIGSLAVFAVSLVIVLVPGGRDRRRSVDVAAMTRPPAPPPPPPPPPADPGGGPPWPR